MIHHLYDGKVEIEFREASHRYKRLDDKSGYKTGVSTIVSTLDKPELLGWAARLACEEFKSLIQQNPSGSLDEYVELARKAHTRKSDKGKDVGSRTHAAAESILLGEPTPIDPDIRHPVDQLNRFILDYKPKTIHTERLVYSIIHDYCGTFDLLCKIDDETILVDIKTNNRGPWAPRGAYPEAFFQLGGYHLAYSEETGERADDVAVLSLPKERGDYALTRLSDFGIEVEDMESAFKSLVEVQRRKSELANKIRRFK